LGAIIYSLLTGRVPLSLEGASNLKDKLRLVYRGSRMPIVEANPDLRASPELIEMASIVEPMLEPSPQSRPHIDEVKEKISRLWSTIDNTEKLLILIKCK
jgi:serine/threonine protein kinase